MRELKQFGVIPIAYDTLVHIFAHYKSPKDKIADLVKDGALIRLKRGLYVVAPAISEQKLSKELVANHLYGLSYVSLETALSYYGMIPERVHLTRSITTKRAKRFSTPIGSFDFLTMPESWFSIGLRFEQVGEAYAWLMASPEKAVCDMILASHGVRLQSVKAISEFLTEDLRIDFSAVKPFDTKIISQCLNVGRKKNELTNLIKYLSS
ncbi:MAG: hypothetical protein KJ754_00910 [Bacteroidetes bacterium]|jgi:hypothetical protein|nr:hypothetical protein [Bacteroidota bacterium]MBU1577965.1 hypothetical protein [Bacteroidota bacterium]MDA3942233.1 hypothetical protein [Bacteroidota bacterium]